MEDIVANQLGKVDAIKLGHHGIANSNASSYHKRLHPRLAVLTGSLSTLPDASGDASFDMKTEIITADEAIKQGTNAIVLGFNERNLQINVSGDLEFQIRERDITPHFSIYSFFQLMILNGRFNCADKKYWFDHNYIATEDSWKLIDGTWYYLTGSGAMATNWVAVSGKWHYMNEDGAMQTVWLKLDDTWYYLNSSGAILAGWQ